MMENRWECQKDAIDTDLRINAPDKAAGSIEVLNSFQTTADIAGLYQASKEIYKNKEVLAVILKSVVKEFEPYSYEKIMTFIEADLRKESKLFDFPCFREAWLNACLHNRWSRQTPPAVYMFEDRIEVISVGGLPEGLILEEFYEGKSKPVNLELQQIMVQLDYIEQTGHGVPLIVSKYEKEVFDITENFITVTIPLNKDKVVERDLQKKKGIVLNECDKKILSRMKENSNITVHEISGQIGVGVTTVTKHIRVLREKGIIKRIGSKKNGQWVIEEEIL